MKSKTRIGAAEDGVAASTHAAARKLGWRVVRAVVYLAGWLLIGVSAVFAVRLKDSAPSQVDQFIWAGALVALLIGTVVFSLRRWIAPDRDRELKSCLSPYVLGALGWALLAISMYLLQFVRG